MRGRRALHWAERIVVAALWGYSLWCKHAGDQASATYWLWLGAFVEAMDIWGDKKQ